jgi:serine/threonine protein kinase
MLTCSKCSAQIPDDLIRCPGCGADAPTDPGIDPVVLRASEAVTAPVAVDSKRERVQDRLQTALGSNYEVRGCVGRGGFAEVYEVWDLSLERKLAAKVLMPEIAATPGMIQRFTHEARTVARLNHPAILQIHFVGDADELAYYVMPFVEGDSVQDLLLRQGKFSTAQTVAVAKPILQALAHAHEAGLIHRDIKPDNVMLEGKTKRALLVDFGIAKALNPDKASNLTQTGHTVGTPNFMSPEQALGDTLDGRSDLYSFGATLFEMVTGKKPYVGETAQEIVAQHVADPIPVPAQVDPTVPDWLSDVVVRLMQKLPDERFQTADEVVAALDAQAVADYSALDALVPDDAVPGGMVIQGSGWAMDTDLEPSAEIRPSEQDVYPGKQDAEPIKDEGWDPVQGTGSQTIGMMSLEEQMGRASPPDTGGTEPRETAPAQDGEPTPVEPADPPRAEEPPPPPPPKPPSHAEPPPQEPLEPTAPAAPEGPDPRVVVKTVDAMRQARKEAADARRKKTIIAVGSITAVVVGAVMVFGVGGGRSGSGGPRYTFVTNSLIEPVELVVDGQLADTLWPRQRDTLPQDPQVSWRLLRPLGGNGQPLGVAFTGVLSGGAESQGNRFFNIVGRTRGRSMFAPVISNPTNRALTVLVNADIPEAARCNCVIPPRSTDVQIGYYPLRSNPTFRFYPSNANYRGRYVEVVEMAGGVDASSGVLTVEVPRR